MVLAKEELIECLLRFGWNLRRIHALFISV